MTKPKVSEPGGDDLSELEKKQGSLSPATKQGEQYVIADCEAEIEHQEPEPQLESCDDPEERTAAFNTKDYEFQVVGGQGHQILH